MGSSSAENDIGVFVGNKLSLQPALTTKTTDCIQGCMNRSTTGRLRERIISSALTLFRPHLDMVSSFASPSIRQTSNGGKIKAGPPGQLGLEDLLCEGRLKDQSLFSHQEVATGNLTAAPWCLRGGYSGVMLLPWCMVGT